MPKTQFTIKIENEALAIIKNYATYDISGVKFTSQAHFIESAIYNFEKLIKKENTMSVQKLDSQTWKCEERNFTFTVEEVKKQIADLAKDYPRIDEREAEVYELIKDLTWDDANMQRLAEEINKYLHVNRHAYPHKRTHGFSVADKPAAHPNSLTWIHRDGLIQGGLAAVAMQIFE